MVAKKRRRPRNAKTPRPAKDTGRRAALPYRRAQRDRGAETRAQLIEAALDVFGRLGFEGATTREIAKAADANLAAIVYHFGGKEALYLAVAEHVATGIAEKIGPALAVASDPGTAMTPETARMALAGLVDTFVEVILGSAEAERWARFIVREQMQPTAAFDIIYRFLGGAVATGTRLLATILARPESDELRLKVFTIIGQVLVFRVAQTLVLRAMGWRTIAGRERAAIKRLVLDNMTAILSGSAQ